MQELIRNPSNSTFVYQLNVAFDTCSGYVFSLYYTLVRAYNVFDEL